VRYTLNCTRVGGTDTGHRESATPPGVAPRSVRRHYLSFGIIHRPSATTREPSLRIEASLYRVARIVGRAICASHA
jgi:hypothetical protein